VSFGDHVVTAPHLGIKSPKRDVRHVQAKPAKT